MVFYNLKVHIEVVILKLFLIIFSYMFEIMTLIILTPRSAQSFVTSRDLTKFATEDQEQLQYALKGKNYIFHLLNRNCRLTFKNEQMLMAKNYY